MHDAEDGRWCHCLGKAGGGGCIVIAFLRFIFLLEFLAPIHVVQVRLPCVETSQWSIVGVLRAFLSVLGFVGAVLRLLLLAHL